MTVVSITTTPLERRSRRWLGDFFTDDEAAILIRRIVAWEWANPDADPRKRERAWSWIAQYG